MITIKEGRLPIKMWVTDIEKEDNYTLEPLGVIKG